MSQLAHRLVVVEPATDDDILAAINKLLDEAKTLEAVAKRRREMAANLLVRTVVGRVCTQA